MRRPNLIRICKWGILAGSLMLMYISVTNRLPEDGKVAREIKGSKKLPVNENKALKKDEAIKSVQNASSVKVNNAANLKDNFLPGSYRVWAFSYDIFLLSVILGNSSSNRVWDQITIHGWEHLKHARTSFICCIIYKSGTIQSVNMTRKIPWTLNKNTQMVAKQYVCPNPRNELKDPPTAVTISGGAKPKCHRMHSWYLQPHYAQAHKKETAVCTKIVSREVSADDILAWFEVHRRLGVKKVLAYTYNLEPKASKILQHYKSLGIAELIPFRLPKTYQGKQAVDIGPKDIQAWNVVQTLVSDCLERSRGYQHVVVIDVDEYLIPNKVKTWPELFDKLWKNSPAAAGFSFKVHVHITSWAVTKSSSKFTAGKYTNRTGALTDRMKHVTRPDRLQAGGLSAHSFTSGKDYRGFWVSEADATIHHFRPCSKSSDWEEEVDKTCLNLGNFRDKSVANILAPLENGIMKLKASILNSGRH